MKRQVILEGRARCQECAWYDDSREAIRWAKKHHRNTGHRVVVTQKSRIEFTRPLMDHGDA